MTSPTAKTSPSDNFGDFWANSNGKPSQGQTVQSPLNKPPQLVQVPSSGSKPVQPNPMQQPPPQNPKPEPPKPADKGKTTTFNQLFGLGPKS